MRIFFAIFFFLVVAVISIAGFRGQYFKKPPLEVFPDMDRQAKIKPQTGSTLYADGRGDRPHVPGTVPHITEVQEQYPWMQPKDRLVEDSYLATGKLPNGEWGRGFPLAITNEMMLLGQKKYNLNCAICHGEAGDGNGITKNYGMVATPSYHGDLYRNMSEGEIYNTVTNGKNTMMGYGAKLTVEERWAVVAYLRTLQLSQNATPADLPADKRKELGL